MGLLWTPIDNFWTHFDSFPIDLLLCPVWATLVTRCEDLSDLVFGVAIRGQFGGNRSNVHYYDASREESTGFGQEDVIKKIWADQPESPV